MSPRPCSSLQLESHRSSCPNLGAALRHMPATSLSQSKLPVPAGRCSCRLEPGHTPSTRSRLRQPTGRSPVPSAWAARVAVGTHVVLRSGTSNPVPATRSRCLSSVVSPVLPAASAATLNPPEIPLMVSQARLRGWVA